MNPKDSEIHFGRGAAVLGLFAGVGLGVGVPAIVLGLGHNLTGAMQMVLCIVAISVGGLVALTAAFFGSVMPAAVRAIDRDHCRHQAKGQQEDTEQSETET